MKLRIEILSKYLRDNRWDILSGALQKLNDDYFLVKQKNFDFASAPNLLQYLTEDENHQPCKVNVTQLGQKDKCVIILDLITDELFVDFVNDIKE